MENRKLLPNINKPLTHHPEKGGYISYNADGRGTQDRKFAANCSFAPTEREDKKCFAIYNNL
jgi:hypothetical protein